VKQVNFDRNKADILGKYFSELKSTDTKGAEIARNYLNRSNDIGMKLVSDNVANSVDDVNTVMLTGFYHAYGPINDYIK